MKYGNLNLEDAANHAIMKHLVNLEGDGGLIGIDREGNIVMPFNCEGMYRASKNKFNSVVEIYR